jgi:hypothetical protein
MAWIESHQSLERHPKLLSIALKLNTDKFGAIGRIHCLWWWCLDYATDGDLRKFDPDTVVMACSTPMDLLVECEFVDRRPYLRVHDWWHYAGRFIKIKYKDYPDKWKRIEVLYKGSLKGIRYPSLKPTNQPTDLNQPNQPYTPMQKTPKALTKSFEKPTKEEVADYARSIGFKLDGEGFLAYYEARGWKYGPGRPMVDWKSAVVTWKKRAEPSAMIQPPRPPKPAEVLPRDEDLVSLEDLHGLRDRLKSKGVPHA